MTPADFTIPCTGCLAETAPDPTGMCPRCAALPTPTHFYRDRTERTVEGPGTVVSLKTRRAR